MKSLLHYIAFGSLVLLLVAGVVIVWLDYQLEQARGYIERIRRRRCDK